MEDISNVDVLAIGVHPDDIELSCAGTLIKHIDLGYTVGLCDLTQGELGSRGSADSRLKEANASMKLMGAQWRVNLSLRDGFFTNDESSKLQLISLIRAAKPKIILANATKDRHPDHGRAATLASECAFYSGLVKIKTSYQGKDQSPWRPQNIYHYIQDREITPDFVIDISAQMDKKISCILSFETQFNSTDDGPVTPISTPQFMDFMKAKNMVYGRDIQADYAEAFIKSKHLGVKNLFDLA